MTFGKALRVTKNFYKKQCLPVITQNEKHLSKQFILITCTLEKWFVAPATLEGFESFLFKDRTYKCSLLWTV